MSRLDTYISRLEESAAFLQRRLGEAPRTGMVLGSGLGGFVTDLPGTESIPYGEIPHFPISSVVGHSGTLTLAHQQGHPFWALQGRVHLYEGIPACEVVFAVRALALWGTRIFLITNAAGGISERLYPGSLMLIRDHINLTGENPLCGPNLESLGERFPDMSQAYDALLRRRTLEWGKELGLELSEGVYVALRGPSYETPAEIRMCARLGADAVGMSTVPEVIALRHMKRRVLGISCITNMAAGIQQEALRHEEVLETTERVRGEFGSLLLRVVQGVGEE